MSTGPNSSFGSVNRVSKYSKYFASISFENMSIIADFAVPGGPTMTMCSPAMADTVIRRMISCLSRNCAPIWRARSWNAADARATSTAKLRGVVGGATMQAGSHYPKTVRDPG
jgi:hypothetical protein